MNVVIAMGLVALGMCIDAMYQNKIRIAECDAYEVGYQCGLKENTIHKNITVPDVPSMAEPVEMPPTFEERMRKHGQATVIIQSDYATLPGGYGRTKK